MDARQGFRTLRHDEGLPCPIDPGQPCAGWMPGTQRRSITLWRGGMSAAASWWHCGTKTMGRSIGRSAVAAAAYRMGEKLHDERTDELHDYTRRSGVLDKFIVAPEDSPAWAYQTERLWNEAERAEKRKDARFARETELALPAVLSADERRGIAYELAHAISDRYGVAVAVAMHEPGRKGDQRNYHAHLMFTVREMTPAGLGAKTRILDDKKTGPEEFKKIQEIAAGIMNCHLSAANSDIRVDHRSFAERGIDQEPTTHLGPAASGMEQRGEASDRGDINREAEQKNREKQESKAALALVDKEIAEEKTRLAEPPSNPQDARERLQDDRQVYAAGIRAAAKLEKDLPADRMGWGERMAQYVARRAKSLFDSIAHKALTFARPRIAKPERRQRQQPTAQNRRWQNQEQARRHEAEGRGHDL